MKIEKEKTACLTGHRPKGLPWGYNEIKENCLRFKDDLKAILTSICQAGIKNFLVGMAEGFDMIGAEVLTKLRKGFTNIQIIAVVPCKNQEIKWKPGQQKRYHKILKQCDDVVVLSDTYTKNCMNDRNKFMVLNSSIVIACFNGKPSGTGNTICFAKQNGCTVKIINVDEYK